MLRSSLYRRVAALVLATCSFTALCVGLYGGQLIRQIHAASREERFDDASNRVALLGAMVGVVEGDMLARGRSALLELARRWPDEGSARRADMASVAEAARRFGVDDVYFIDRRGTIFASSFQPDIGLDLASLDPRFADFLRGLLGRGEQASNRLTASTQTGALNTYQYYSPPGSDCIIEVSTRLEGPFRARYGGMGYDDFVGLLFKPYGRSGQPRLNQTLSLDLITQNTRGSWSLLHAGRAHPLSDEVGRSLARSGEATVRHGSTMSVYRPISFRSRAGVYTDPFVIQIDFDLSGFNAYRLAVALIAVALSLVVALVAFLYARHSFDKLFSLRIENLERSIALVADGDYRTCFDDKGDDEICAIGRSIGRMVETILEKEDRIRKAQRLETIGSMAGGLAHDFNNIVTGIMGTVSSLREGLEGECEIPRDELREALALISRTAGRGGELVRALLDVGFRRPPVFGPVELGALVTETAELARAAADESVLVVDKKPAEPVYATGDAMELRRVLLNLCLNAIHAMTIMRSDAEEKGGLLSISLSRTGASEGGRAQVEISVADTGVGIKAADIDKVFMPFYSTKPRSVGTGLGLSAALSIVEAHGGGIGVESQPGRGSRFTIRLPAAPKNDDSH